MIIRSNLASSPIKNYSIFLLECTLLGIAAVLFTFFNLGSLRSSYDKNQELKKTIAIQQTQLHDLESKKKNLDNQIAKIKTPQFISETEFMNNAIKRRMFSWTALFDHFEQILPPTVKMISVLPAVTEKNIAINMEMAGRSLADMLELVRTLERDSEFSEVTLKAERSGEDGEMIYFSISLNYTPPPGKKVTANEL